MAAPITFLREVRLELDKVVWPTRDQVVRLTVLVTIISLIVGLFIGALDFVFFKVMEILL